MFKKSIARIDNESSQSELSNPALHDIIATNHVTYPKVIISISKMNLYFFFLSIFRNHTNNVCLGRAKQCSS